ncbi:MBL fold metallo-hydrolase [Streptomyces sp. ZAF1911]|uniref:MBL fold metallo-hydrolase n=1 Tax=Streptomyces sp. ZAF1911 TaxID=2944129 RepID=UPI00237C17C1|nr:MBL fold metallo-hydrolase [Streptomyces sp. ZAF1911]MDD9380634.1 MBL fold metallo-hydrolase [Streptomyces sp. ZAF1911]
METQGQVVALLDATGSFFEPAVTAFPGAGAAAWERAALLDPGAAGPDGSWRLDFRCFAVSRPGGRWVLIDAGVGPAQGPAAGWAPVPGRLPAALGEAGIAPADVEAVVLTHLHEDHTGWTQDAAGRPFFPDARYLVQRAEVAALDRADPVWDWTVAPLRATGQLHEVAGEHRLAPGITLLPTPGHTPGHQSVLVEGSSGFGGGSGGWGRGRDVLVTGDVLVHAVQLADPAVPYSHERDRAAARASREELLALAVRRHAVLATAHLTRAFVEPTCDRLGGALA